MPSTAQNVAWINQRNPKYSPSQILEFLNEIHLHCVHQEIDQFRKIDSTTGMPPNFPTVADQYVYTAPADCRKIAGLFILSRDLGYISSYYALWRTMENYRFEEIRIFGKTYYKLPYIEQRDATYNQPSQLIFGGQYNPPTSTDHYFLLYWIKANQILEVTDELQLPEECHYPLRKAVSAYLATQDYGETSIDDVLIDKCKKIVRNTMNKGANGRVSRTPWTMENRDW